MDYGIFRFGNSLLHTSPRDSTFVSSFRTKKIRNRTCELVINGKIDTPLKMNLSAFKPAINVPTKRIGDCEKDIEIRLNEEKAEVEFEINQMQEERWPLYTACIETWERYLERQRNVRIQLICHVLNETASKLLFRLMKSVQRHLWIEDKYIEVWWHYHAANNGMKKSGQDLADRFDVDIKFKEIQPAVENPSKTLL
ncbi:MAG: SiaC family regulatory phosphoprotein [Cyclobacteriaceae bacterium]|nr:SiaC family regulatory phosphoprotein [Cyclobacteriaceae bacterium HetDA_MAG_MS6]